MRRLKLFIERMLVFALGVLTAWLIAFVIFDFADKRLPVLLAVAVDLRRRRLCRAAARGAYRPAHSEARARAELHADRRRVAGRPGQSRAGRRLSAISAPPSPKAGWSEADVLALPAPGAWSGRSCFNRPYLTAPFSTLYLFDRGQDVGFQLPIGDSPRKRHHVRFWGLPVERAEAAARHPEILAARRAGPAKTSARSGSARRPRTSASR